MGLIAREIRNFPSWGYRSEPPSWLFQDKIPSDIIADFSTRNNCFSLFRVCDENISEQLLRIATAICLNLDEPQRKYIICFDEKMLLDIVSSIECTKGQTIDDTVNKWHINAKCLTSKHIYQICRTLYYSLEEGNFHIYAPSDLKKCALDLNDSGEIKIKKEKIKWLQ